MAVTANVVTASAQFMSAQCQSHKFTHVNWSRGGMPWSYIEDYNEYGKAFVAMALNHHANEMDKENRMLNLDDTMASKLIGFLPR